MADGEAVVVPPKRRPRVSVSARTRRRWIAQASTAARHVLHVLSSLRAEVLDGLVARLGLDATRRELLAAFRLPPGAPSALAALTVVLGRALPGLRVM